MKHDQVSTGREELRKWLENQNARRIWVVDQWENRGTKHERLRTVSCYAVGGKTIVVLDLQPKDDDYRYSWEVFVPVANTNDVAETFVALSAYVEAP